MYINIKLIRTKKVVFITLELPSIRSRICIAEKSFPLERHVFLYFLGIYHPVFSKEYG